MPARPALVALALALVCLIGCGGEDQAPKPSPAAESEGRPVNDDQALVLARLLQQNWQHRGARFTGEVPVQGLRIPMSGRVDFRSGRGTATLREPSAAPRRYVWTRRAVYAQAEPGSRRYVVQPPSPDGDPVHAAIAMVNLLSAETIDNTTNIKDQGARFLRRDTIDDEAVDVYRYGPDGATTYWVDRDDGLLRRLEAVLAESDPLVVDLTAHERVQVALPPRAQAR
jgi:hypothetical protein